MTQFKGKAIYTPSGKAGEYSQWACNFYVGCSNGCEYCYLKKGRGKAILGGDKPKLKACFKDEDHALAVFEKELLSNIEQLRKHGLFFSFSTDPMLRETADLTIIAVNTCMKNDVPVKILTKMDIVNGWWKFGINQHAFPLLVKDEYRSRIALGFTLTGHDEMEPGACSNTERIEAMKLLHKKGFRTFASIEPIIDLPSSLDMIEQSLGYCDLYKIGLMSGGPKPDKDELFHFVGRVTKLAEETGTKIYWKESIRKYFDFPDFGKAPSVNRDYDLFTNK